MDCLTFVAHVYLGKGIESISLEGGDNVSPSDSAILRMMASRRDLQYISLFFSRTMCTAIWPRTDLKSHL